MNFGILRIDRPFRRLVQRLRMFTILKFGKPRLIIHYTPDVSGGAATFMFSVAKVLPEYYHLIVTNRDVAHPIAKLMAPVPHLLWVQDYISEKNIHRYLAVKPAAIFNHLSWDLKPVDRRWLEQSSTHFSPRVISFCHTIGAVRKIPDTASSADTTIVFSHYLEDAQLEALLYSHPSAFPVRQMPSVFDEKELVKTSIQGPLRRGRFVAGNISNGAPWKHSEDFVNIMNSIESACPNIFFRFLGAKDLVSKLKGSKTVEILPPFSVETSDYLNSISVLIHKTEPDIVETWCRVVTEAMFAGVPVIAEKRGGIREQIIHGETGFLCETPDDFPKYARLLCLDDILYRRITSQARAFAITNFGLEASRKNLFGLLD